MKNILLVMILMTVSFFSFSQTTFECIDCEKMSSDLCAACNENSASSEYFNGLVIKKSGRAYFIYKPFKMYVKGVTVYFEDWRETKVSINFNETFYSSFPEMIADLTACQCSDSGGSGDGVQYSDSLTVFVTPNQLNDSLQNVTGDNLGDHIATQELDMSGDSIINVLSVNLQNGGQLDWNSEFYTVNIETGIGPVLQLGQEQYLVFYNNTGSQIDNGTVMRPVAGFLSGGVVYPTFEKAQANTHELAEGTLTAATMDIPNGTIGLCTRFGRISGINTSSFNPGDDLYLSPTTAGEITNVRPTFPDYEIKIGGVIEQDPTNGVIAFNVTTSITDTYDNNRNGTFRESFDFRITSDGATITGSLEPSNGHPDMTMSFSDGLTTFDTSPPATITLTAGTDEIPQVVYVYIPQSTKVLTQSTSYWPTTEHIPVARCVLQTAASTQTYGALGNQNINNEIQSTTTNQGHLSHIGTRIRALPADWESGAESTLSVSGAPSDVWISNTSGKVFQMHIQDYPVRDMGTGDEVQIINDPVTSYRATSNLGTITEDANGSTLNNRWFSVVAIGICNKSGEESHTFVNLPTGSYTSEADAVEDANGFSVYTIPKEFKGTGFLMARFTMRRSGTTFTYNSGVGYQDLRGFVPNSTAGSGAGSSGITTFTGLTDTPSSYLGEAGKVPVVNVGETGLEFAVPPGDNLGNHTATQDLDMDTNDVLLGGGAISYNASNPGIFMGTDGNIAVGENVLSSDVSSFRPLVSKSFGSADNNQNSAPFFIMNSNSVGNDVTNLLGLGFGKSTFNPSPYVWFGSSYPATDRGSAKIGTQGASGFSIKWHMHEEGNLQWDSYGLGTNTGTESYNISVDALGNVIEGTYIPMLYDVTLQEPTTKSIFIGENAGSSFFGGTNQGYANTVVGFNAGANLETTIVSQSSSNSFFGYEAGLSTTTASLCTFIGTAAGRGYLTGNRSNFFGWHSGISATGLRLTGIGSEALSSTTGEDVVGIGSEVLKSNVAGTDIVSVGNFSLRNNVSGTELVAIGHNALYNSTGLGLTTAVGNRAGYFTTSGHSNTLIGRGAGEYVTTADNITAIGLNAGTSGATNLTGDNNTFLGRGTTYTSGSITNSTAIGYSASVSTSNMIQLGNASVTEVNTYGNMTIGGTCTVSSTIWINSAKTLGIFSGSGSPEGSISADVGSTYHRTDGGAGTSYYVKESGTGNTGWVGK